MITTHDKLTAIQSDFLRLLYHKSRTANRMALAMNISKESVYVHMSRMKQRGYVIRSRGRYSLSEKGFMLADNIRREWINPKGEHSD